MIGIVTHSVEIFNADNVEGVVITPILCLTPDRGEIHRKATMATATTTKPPFVVEKETQTPVRVDSFAFKSFDDSETSPPVGMEDEEDSSALRLAEENELLKAEIKRLKAKVAILHNRSQRKDPDSRVKNETQRTSKNTQPVVHLELPQSLRKAAGLKAPSLNCCNRSELVKEERSNSTNDDQETQVLHYDVEAHESAPGLHHRSHLPQHLTQSNGGSPTTKNTRPLSLQNSFASADSLSDHEDEEVEILLGHHRNQHNRDEDLDIEEVPQSFYQSVADRAGWLVGLLVLQSMSSFILARNEALLQEHLVIVRFLTMLVGAGGNAGNQASVRGKSSRKSKAASFR